MAKIDFQVNNTETDSGDGNGQAHRSEDAKLQRLGVNQQLKVCARHCWPRSLPAATDCTAEAIWPIVLDRFHDSQQTSDEIIVNVLMDQYAVGTHASLA